MEFVKELVQVIKKYSLKEVDIISNDKQHSFSKIGKFYQGVKEGVINSDDDAIAHLYGQQDAIVSYKKLKYRLKERLVNSLFLIDLNQSNFTNIQKAYYKCYKDWAAVRILLGRSAKKSAIALSKKVLSKAIKYEFTELIVNICRVMRLYCATVEGDKKEFKFYDALLKKSFETLRAEIHAEELYEDLLIDFVNSRATKNEGEGNCLSS